MADSFTINQVQGQLGEFAPVLDAATVVTFSINNVQGQLGEFAPVLDEAAAGEEPEVPAGPSQGKGGVIYRLLFSPRR